MAGNGHEQLVKPPESTSQSAVAKLPEPAGHPALVQIAQQHGTDAVAIATAINDHHVPIDAALFDALQKTFGNGVSQKVIAELQKPKAPPTAVAPTPAPTVEAGAGEPKASPGIVSAKVQVEPAVVQQVAQIGGQPQPQNNAPALCPAPAVVFAEVKATLEGLGFAASGKALPIVAHHAPAMTDTGFEFKNTAVAPDGTETARAPVKTDYMEGMGKKHATGALAGSDDVTLNPAGDFTTLIHETVHLFQKGEIGRFLVEPMTEIIAAMAFTRLAGKGVVTGAYQYAAEYLPWVNFVKEVVAPKVGWQKLFGYYVGQGMTTFGHFAAGLGFREPAAEMQKLKKALSTGDATEAEAVREAILTGPAKGKERRGFETVQELPAGDHDMSSFEAWLPTFGAVIDKDKKPGESNAQTAQRLASENKRAVITGAINEAKQHQKTAAPGLLVEIGEFIAAYEHALTEIPA